MAASHVTKIDQGCYQCAAAVTQDDVAPSESQNQV
jgi:hypothetical protein